MSPSKWWEMKLDESPSDEASNYELEAASFDIPPPHLVSHAAKPSKSRRRRRRMHQSQPRTTVGRKDQGQTDQQLDLCQSSGTILDLLEKNLCVSESISDSPAIRRLENSLTLARIEKQVAKLNDQKMWSFLGHDEDSFYESSSESHQESSSSFEESLDENEIQHAVDGLAASFHEHERIAKIKRMALGPLFEEEKDTQQTHPLTPRNKNVNDHLEHKQKRPRGRSREPRPVRLMRHVRKGKHKHNQAAIDESIVSPDGLPSTVKTNAHNDDHMSSLTEERLAYAGYSDIQAMKTCVPFGLQRKISSLKKLRLIKSGSSMSQTSGESHPLMRVVTDSVADSSGTPSCAYYVYDYESTTHAYVAYTVRGKKASESLRLYEHPSPESFDALKSEVVVKIDAATVCNTDCAIRKALWWGESSTSPLKAPIVPGTAFVGRIDDTHIAKASRGGLKKGDRVISLVRVGGNSRHLCIDVDRLVKIPVDNQKQNAVACLPEIYLAAFQALHFGHRNSLRYRKSSLSKKKILVLGGTSTLGVALIELARAAGCETVYATGRDKDFDKIGDLGGLPLSRDPRHWISSLAFKMDLVVGLDYPYAKSQLQSEHIQALNRSGKIIIIGGPDQGEKSTFELDSFDERSSVSNRKLHNYNVFDSWDADMRKAKRDLVHLLKLFKDGLLNPKITERIPLDKIAKAHDYLDEKQVNGFIICEPWISGRNKGVTASTVIVASKTPRKSKACSQVTHTL